MFIPVSSSAEIRGIFMSAKISDLPHAVMVQNADLVPIVQGGVNMSCSRAQIFIAKPGEDLTLSGTGANFFSIMDVGGISSVFGLGTEYGIRDSSGNDYVNVDSLGNFSLGSSAPASIVIGGLHSKIEMNATGRMFLTSVSGESITVEFDSLTPSSWAGAPPPDLAAAVERVSLALAGLLGHPIP